jgi:hypothetical protein
MYSEIDYNFLEKLLSEGFIRYSSISLKVKKSNYFSNLISSGILKKERSGRGYVIKVGDKGAFEAFFNKTFTNTQDSEISKVTNVAKFKDSKGRKTESNYIVLLRGSHSVRINERDVDLSFYTTHFGVFATQLYSMYSPKICFVENLDVFLQVETLIDPEYIFFHTYGRVGHQLISKIETEEILVFSDYDYIGLNEYLNFKELFPNTRFFVPDDYQEKFDNYAKSIKQQKPRKKVLASTEDIVVKIRTQILKTHKFLEQQALFINE